MTSPVHTQLETLKKTRLFTLSTIKGLTISQLNKIPQGYNNNVIWNVAHLVAAQEGVCYLRAGLQTNVSELYFNSYKPGSKPVSELHETEVEEIKTLLITSIEKLEIDILQNAFNNYVPWATRYGIEMNDINDAVNFLPFHEGMHLGYIMALKRLL